MGFGLLIVIHGAMQLPRAAAAYFRPLGWSRISPSAAGIALSLLLVAASLVTVPKNYALPKQDYSGAKKYVEGHSDQGDRVIAVSLAGVVYGSYLTSPWAVVRTDAELEMAEQTNAGTWLVYTLPIEIKAFRPELWRAIERDYEVIQVFPGTLNGGEVYVCRKRSRS
jgi:hypothetical protein